MKKIYTLLTVTILISLMSFSQSEGDIIITEILQNSVAVPDTLGEWFEVHNTTGTAIDLDGWTISDNGANSHLITGSLVVSAGGYAVLGRNIDTNINGGTLVDYAYGTDITLSNGDDEIILTTLGGTEIDRVEYDGGTVFPDPQDTHAASISLNPDSLTGSANDNGGNWCVSTTPFGDGDKGTPGLANDTCGTPCDLVIDSINAVCDAITAGTDTYTLSVSFSSGSTSNYNVTVTNGTTSGNNPSVDASGVITVIANEGEDTTITIENLGAGGSCNYIFDITSPVCALATCSSVGSVIVTEIFQNPVDAVGDSFGEWFEIHNTTGSDIDLEGWAFLDDDDSLFDQGFVIPSSLIIPAGGYLLFANNGDAATNGGLPTPDYVYAASSYLLLNGSDEIIIDCSGTIIDQVLWDNGATFPDPEGSSMSLNVANLNSTDNDNGANWSTVTFTYGNGSFGTPGGANDTSLSVNSNEIAGFSVYPNPIENNQIFVNTLSSNSKSVEIFSILGQLIFAESYLNTNFTINLNNPKTGLYLLKVTDGNNTSTQKLIIK